MTEAVAVHDFVDAGSETVDAVIEIDAGSEGFLAEIGPIRQLEFPSFR